MRFDVIEIVLVETPSDLFPQLGSRPEIDLRGMDVDMAHIGG
jgi:hypothetical protein